jgi:hypothetical protein
LLAALLLVPAQSYALGTNLTLTSPAPVAEQYQQTQNSPCVLGEPSCNDPAGWTHTNFPPGGGSQNYDATSPTYTVGQITGVVGTSFIVGIDVNTTTSPLATEKLAAFEVYIGGVLTYAYYATGCSTGDYICTGTDLTTANNGNGYADALLKTISLAGYSAGTTVTFRAVVNSATDGREQFFLINTTTPPPVIPEPASLALLGTGLLGVARAVRRRRQNRSVA